MARCIRCKLNIRDNAVMCPLCNGVLVRGDDEYESVPEGEHYISKSMTYPDVSFSLRRITFAIKIAIFVAVLIEIAAVIVNYMTYRGVWWALIVGLGLTYGCFTLVYSFSTSRSLQNIINVQALVAMLIAVALDHVLGYQGWSIKFAIPICLMAVSVGVVVLMIINVESWQNYIMTQISAAVISVILAVLHLLKVFHSSQLIYIAVVVTLAILSGTILFGSRLVSDEIKRRFRV